MSFRNRHPWDSLSVWEGVSVPHTEWNGTSLHVLSPLKVWFFGESRCQFEFGDRLLYPSGSPARISASQDGIDSRAIPLRTAIFENMGLLISPFVEVMFYFRHDPRTFNSPASSHLPYDTSEEKNRKECDDRCRTSIYVVNRVMRCGGALLSFAAFLWCGKCAVDSLILYERFRAAFRFSFFLSVQLFSFFGIFAFASGCLGLTCKQDSQCREGCNSLHESTLSVTHKYLLTSLSFCNTVMAIEGTQMANILSTEKQVAVISALAEGSAIRQIERITGVHRDTIMRLGVRVGQGCAKVLDSKMRGLACQQLQFDELWGFIGKKQRHVTPEDSPEMIVQEFRSTEDAEEA